MRASARTSGRGGPTVIVEFAGDALPATHQLAVLAARQPTVEVAGGSLVRGRLGRPDVVPDELVNVLAPADQLAVLERRERLLVGPVEERLREGEQQGSGVSLPVL